MSIEVLASAKVNLFLHVINKRADGYHDLETAFLRLDYGDTLQFVPRDDAVIRLLGDMPACPTNLILKAARALQDTLRARGNGMQGADIHLTKRLPMGAGLGGGSSNAAATLKGLCALWRANLSQKDMLNIGRCLGADVPFFVYDVPCALGRGIGEELTAVPAPALRLVVLTPDVHISTKEAFATLKHQQPSLLTNNATTSLAYILHNRDFDNAFTDYACTFAPVRAALEHLDRYGRARLSGTGSACFLVLDARACAQDILANAPCAGFVARVG